MEWHHQMKKSNIRHERDYISLFVSFTTCTRYTQQIGFIKGQRFQAIAIHETQK